MGADGAERPGHRLNGIESALVASEDSRLPAKPHTGQAIAVPTSR